MRKFFLIIIALIVVVLPSCKKDAPPALPPAESMVMDFKAFGGGTPQEKSAIMKDGLSQEMIGTNLLYSTTVVNVWNLIIFMNLWVPISAWYAVLANDEWEEIEKNTWQWTFSYKVFIFTYDARLVGHAEDNSIRWEMYVKKNGLFGFAEFKWFEGTTAKDGTSGSWTFYEEPAKPVKYLQVDWLKTGNSIGSIKYTNLKEKDDAGAANPYYNNSIEYGATATTPYDRFFTITAYNTISNKVDTVNIEWNKDSKEGQIKAPYFNDSYWHAWDTAGLDK